MKGILISFSRTFKPLQKLTPQSVLHPDSRIIIENTVDNSDHINIKLINPFDYIINNFLVSPESQKIISINFNSFMPSGLYYLILESLSNAKESNFEEKLEYMPFQFSGTFSRFIV